jgi:hypothetical protein
MSTRFPAPLLAQGGAIARAVRDVRDVRAVHAVRALQTVRALLLPLLALLCAHNAAAQQADADGATRLRESFAGWRARADGNPFGTQLFVQSGESARRLQGDVYALIDHPHPAVRSALSRAGAWCDILILHLNVKYCRASAGTPERLDVSIGRKFDQPLADAYALRFAFRVTSTSDDYLRVVLDAPTGPMGTRDYVIQTEVAPLDAGRSVLHMTYSYAYDSAARWALQAYLATVARDKVGFTVVGKRASGEPQHVGGVRGVVERNAMRYYLAVVAYLGTRGLPPQQQASQSLRDWFAATERHALQLHEIDRDAYLTMKEAEIRRQQNTPPPARP